MEKQINIDENIKKEIIKKMPVLENYLNYFKIKVVDAQEIILRENDIAKYLYIVAQGCLRSYYIKEDGTEVTFQFFLENQGVTSFESSFTGKPTRQYIDAIEDSTLLYISIEKLNEATKKDENVKTFFNNFLRERLILYMNKYSSFILDSPEKRYKKLIEERPELVTRIPQQHIATYLGITPVSLSRIKKRLKETVPE